MKCDLCDAEATVHETQIVHGQVRVRRLCERHAAESGLTAMGAVSTPPGGAAIVMGVSQKAAGLRCDACGLSYAAFRQHGLLGCPSCYEAFEDKLSPLIARAHQGGTHHIGKTPRRMLAAAREGNPEAIERVLGDARERAERLALLRKQLEEALAQEQYERAAAVRDELRRFEAEESGQASAAEGERGQQGPNGSDASDEGERS
ncbi:MAG: UvrB/UvrC motif-containing protein [Phycisphaerales bacterium]|jgi:protein arginine kinase activator